LVTGARPPPAEQPGQASRAAAPAERSGGADHAAEDIADVPGRAGAVLLQRCTRTARERAEQGAVRAVLGARRPTPDRALQRALRHRCGLLSEAADVSSEVAERLAQTGEELLILNRGNSLAERRLEDGVELGVCQCGEPVVESVA
jgi:hypothetical protein